MKGILLSAALAFGMAGMAAAQSTPPDVAQHQARELARGEPARWSKPDSTTQAQVATKRKEIGAALNEALNDCKRMAAGDRAGCVQQARETYRQDMANVRQLVAQSNELGGVYDTAGPSE